MNPADLGAVFEAWRLCARCGNQFGPPATDDDLEALRRSTEGVPDDLLRVLQFANGLSVLEGNLEVYPAVSSWQAGNEEPAVGIDGFSDRLRRWDWPVPPEFLVIGGNGGGEQLGVWRDARGIETAIVMMASADESFAVVGTGLTTFLRTWTTYYLLAAGGSDAALDALNVPRELRHPDPDDLVFAEIARWSDPDLPHFSMDPYVEAWSSADVRNFVEAIEAPHA